MSLGFEVGFHFMNDFGAFGEKDQSKTYYVLMTPTVDYGKIPPNGEYFLDFLEKAYAEKDEKKFEHVDFAMFGLGDSEY